jgi:TonB-linked SusC/RagA family outer membrane protein
MKKKLFLTKHRSILPCVVKFFKIMKFSIFIVLLATLQTFAVSNYAQTKRIDIRIEASTIVSALEKIENISEFRFFYNNKLVKLDEKVSIDLKDKTINEILDDLFKETDIAYTLNNKQIILFPKESESSLAQQQKSISGKVTDSSGAPLPGVTVAIKGTTKGTITDTNGNYNFSNISENTILVVSFVGMKTQEIKVGNLSSINVTLTEETIGIQEVVAVGYGTLKKGDVTGSVAKVSQEKIKELPSSTIDQKMIGQVAGVQIQQVSGAPGAGTSVKIRGNGSLGAGNEPLYVVDGMPYSSGLNMTANPLLFINPNDIESVTILKDASSTAIYGSRGANGVIMIATKKGDHERTMVNLSVMSGVQVVPDNGRPKLLNQQEFVDLQRNKIDVTVRRLENREATINDYPDIYKNPENLIGDGTDWYGLLLRPAAVHDYNVSLQKGSKESLLDFSVGYYNQEGVVKYTGVERYSGKIGFQTQLGKSVKISASLQPTFVGLNRTNTNNTRDDILGVAIWANPVMTPYDANGNLIPYIVTPQSKYHSSWSFVNPLFALRETVQNEKNFQNLGIAYLEWTIAPGLVAKSSINTIWSTSRYSQYVPSTVGGSNRPPVAGTGASVNSRGQSFTWLNENTLTYNKKIGVHSFNALLGYTAQKYHAENISLNAGPFPNDLIQTINAAQAISSWGESIGEWSMLSYLGRLNYSYKDRYLLTATFRSDGSSRFGANNRFAFFPSFAGAWRVTEENFMKEVKSINNLKLRMSYGKSGNNNIGNYSHLASVSAGSYIFGTTQVTASSVGISNPDLTWEESDQIDGGIDLDMFKSRLTVVVDAYTRKSKNMLLSDIIPSITGFNTQVVNKGSVQNRGLEISIGGTPIDRAIKWDASFNIAFNRNKVLSLNDSNDRILAGNNDNNPTNISVVGKPIGQFYGFIFEGLYTAEDVANPAIIKTAQVYEGNPKYKDVNGDGIVSDLLDYAIIGDPHPDFTYGISNNLSFKQITLGIVINGQYGGSVMNGLRQTTDNLQGFFNISKDWVNRWRSASSPGDGTHYGVPKLTPSWGHRVNSRWVEDASYLRISNVTLGYNIPEKLLKGTGFVNGCRLYASVQNLAMFTKYSGANPEGQSNNSAVNATLAPGFDMTSYPLSRTVSFGLKLTF